ncbi:unnamed protein product [Chilo suppressalis]|uniref:Peptidase S1 domain-containing protein n=1 Tax=Chilo suppressalis TaxID=168631 RepID=A0ABN8B9U0_CHISP|nr:unnamed protein product [Chilo suppressalis]
MFVFKEVKNFLAILALMDTLKPHNCEMETKIIGGSFTTIKQFPHAVFLNVYCKNVNWVCGASVLNQKILITAGHCLSGCEMWADRIDAFGGNEDYTSKLAVYRKVMRIRVHSEYDERTVSNDIGLALVNRNFDLNNNVKRLIVPVQFPNYKTGTVAGWGVTNNWSGGTRVLKSVAQNIRTRDICRAIYGFKSGMLCAGSKEKNVDQPASLDALSTCAIELQGGLWQCPSLIKLSTSGDGIGVLQRYEMASFDCLFQPHVLPPLDHDVFQSIILQLLSD